MKIAFTAKPAADAPVLVLPVEKDGLERTDFGALDATAQALVDRKSVV